MMHQQIQEEEIIERYVRNQLEPAEREAFEEHYFTCDECFENLQTTERFVAGIRDAASRRLLTSPQGEASGWRARSWWLPAFAASAVAVVLLGVTTGWLYFVEMANLRGKLDKATGNLRTQEQARAALEQHLQSELQAEANVPLVMLESTREVQAKPIRVTLPSGATRLVLWVDIGSGHYRTYRMEVLSADDKLLQTVNQLARNSYGALAVSLPAERLRPGEFRIKLFGEEPVPAALLAEYRLIIRRP